MEFSINIPKDANELIHVLQKNGHSAYVVGGCVRDSVLGRIPHDWDICTSATPSEMLEIFKDKRIIETGLQHGTVTVVVNNEPYEITTFRIDGDYSDSRRPDNVIFTDSLREDLKRRDFAINAMAYNDEEGLIDPFHDMEDIKHRKIDCVGSAKDRFSEDALRILRAIRFAAQLDFVISPGTDWQIHRQYKSLENISIERINSEFCKIASSDTFCVQLLLYEDVFSLFIPELKDINCFPQNNPYHQYDVFGHTIHALERCDSKDLTVRLAVLFHDFGKPHCYQDGEDGIRHFKGHGRVSADMTDWIMKRLKFDNKMRNNVVELVYYHDATFEVGKKYIKRWLNKIGLEQFRRLLEVRKADIKGQKAEYEKERIEKVNNIEKILEEVLQEQECFSLKNLAVNGNDLIEMGYKSGKELGKTLNLLLQMVIDGDCPNDKEKLLQEAENLWMGRRM
jgi:tRNA nucleotidyltransferase (CCA-adding enzyme)